VYPRAGANAQPAKRFVAQLFSVLSHPRTLANLGRVGKSYGNGALKVEPRALERLPLPPDVVRKCGLVPPSAPTEPSARQR
jgi:hypothetical protein